MDKGELGQMKGYPYFRSFRTTDIEVTEGRMKATGGKLEALRGRTLGFGAFTILHPTLRCSHETRVIPLTPTPTAVRRTYSYYSKLKKQLLRGL